MAKKTEIDPVEFERNVRAILIAYAKMGQTTYYMELYTKAGGTGCWRDMQRELSPILQRLVEEALAEVNGDLARVASLSSLVVNKDPDDPAYALVPSESFWNLHGLQDMGWREAYIWLGRCQERTFAKYREAVE